MHEFSDCRPKGRQKTNTYTHIFRLDVFMFMVAALILIHNLNTVSLVYQCVKQLQCILPRLHISYNILCIRGIISTCSKSLIIYLLLVIMICIMGDCSRRDQYLLAMTFLCLSSTNNKAAIPLMTPLWSSYPYDFIGKNYYKDPSNDLCLVFNAPINAVGKCSTMTAPGEMTSDV